jgi:hypothetical protein
MRREYWWALVTLIVAIVLALILLNIYKNVAESKIELDCMDATERERVRQLVLDGIDDGLKEQIQHLFETWMKDLTDQPRRAMVGTSNAFNAHVRARAQALAWDPPLCPEKPHPP